jgi:hypothetical protein
LIVNGRSSSSSTDGHFRVIRGSTTIGAYASTQSSTVELSFVA